MRPRSWAGVVHKVEGFFKACKSAPSGLTGTQGAIVPARNVRNLVLDAEVVAAVAAGQFHLWAVDDLDEALELLLGTDQGDLHANGDYSPGSIFGKVSEKLIEFNEILGKIGII